MSDRDLDELDAAQWRFMALSRWENEGGAGPHRPHESWSFNVEHAEVPPLTNAELVQLRIRVIALENLMITLLTDATERQLDLVREMATYISPRPGFTQHPLTTHAAARMIHLVERVGRYRGRKAGLR